MNIINYLFPSNQSQYKKEFKYKDEYKNKIKYKYKNKKHEREIKTMISLKEFGNKVVPDTNYDIETTIIFDHTDIDILIHTKAYNNCKIIENYLSFPTWGNQTCKKIGVIENKI